jgi:hypothetical protein
MKVTRIGLDIAKQVFQMHGVDDSGKSRLRKQLARAKVLEFFAQLPPCLVGIEACGSSHYWGRSARHRHEDRCQERLGATTEGPQTRERGRRRPRSQTCAHRLGDPRPWHRLSAGGPGGRRGLT